MPKDNAKFQRETGLPADSRLVDESTAYSRFVSNQQGGGVDKMLPLTSPKFRVPYDEKHGGEDNLHNRFVKTTFIENKSSFGK